jgi:hypothetical protein
MAAANLESAGQTPLDYPAPLLTALGRRSRHRQTRHRHQLAPRWFSVLVVLALAAANPPTED